MSVDFTEDVLDSRDMLRRLEELRDERTALLEAIAPIAEGEEDQPEQEAEGSTEELALARQDLAEWDEQNQEELKNLESIEDELSPEGETWVADWHFRRYAEEFAEDMGFMGRSEQLDWPFMHIDWERAADDLRTDYTCVEVAGNVYWKR